MQPLSRPGRSHFRKKRGCLGKLSGYFNIKMLMRDHPRGELRVSDMLTEDRLKAAEGSRVCWARGASLFGARRKRIRNDTEHKAIDHVAMYTFGKSEIRVAQVPKSTDGNDCVANGTGLDRALTLG